MSFHTKLSASGAKRWMECPGSTQLIAAGEGHAEDESEFAIEGTNAHTLAAFCLESETEAWEHVGTFSLEHISGDPADSFEVTQEMAENVQVYLDWVRALPEGELAIETRVDDVEVHKEFGGTADAYKLCGCTLHVGDLKYGVGIPVEAEDNPQLMYYAFGVLRKHPEVVNVRMTIIQPRAPHEEGPIRTFAMTADELHRWAEAKLLPAMAATDAPDAPLNPGDWCRWCPASKNLTCPAQQSDLKAMEMAAVTMPAEKMTDQMLSDYREMAKNVTMFIKAINAEVYRRLMNGAKIPGVILKQAKADRVWHAGAEKLARDRWGDQAFTDPKLLSPKQLEDKFPGGKKFTAEHAFKPNTGLTVADDNGKNIAIAPRTAAEMFKGVVSQTQAAGTNSSAIADEEGY